MSHQIKYIATTKAVNIPSDYQVFMVDGTVSGWQPKQHDYHWDHHRQGGADIQVDEMPLPEDNTPIIDAYSQKEKYLNGEANEETAFQAIVTTQIDADACCSAAWLQLAGNVLKSSTGLDCSKSVIDCLRAIAYDCDHLTVSDSLSHLADFAAQAVATLKQDGYQLIQELNFPNDRRQWTEDQHLTYSSAAFERGTRWLIDAALGRRLWPGELGEASEYWKQVEDDKTMLFKTGRITVIDSVALCDARGLGRLIDPRAFVRSIQEFILPHTTLRPEKLTVKDHGLDGYRYTLDCIPNHPKKEFIDYTDGTLKRLSEAERKKAVAENIDCEWGGRRTVAGSAWNAPSHLEPSEVIALL